jgi:branched-chain amino acid transport system ATP-binding protein
MSGADAGNNLLLDVRGISIRFGGLCAVANFSLALPPGALYGLIGPNGAGKTTVFNLLTGVYQPDAGSIHVQGRRIDGLQAAPDRPRGLARTFQNIRLFGELSVLDNVRMGAQMREPHGCGTTLAHRRLRRHRDGASTRGRECSTSWA